MLVFVFFFQKTYKIGHCPVFDRERETKRARTERGRHVNSHQEEVEFNFR
jgi:hypothetical protein